jgi:hypothetical protein
MLVRTVLIAAAFVAPTVAWAQDAATTFRELLIQCRCPVVDRLEHIYATGDPSDTKDKFLVIDFPDRDQDYVQCIFDARTRMLCEASSGFYYDPPGKPRTYHLSASAIAALGRLGFSTDDSAGNFQIEFDVTDPPDLNAIADFMLKALHDGYGARADMKLHFNAPFAPHTSSKCVPVS